MSRVPQAKGGAKSNLAKALAHAQQQERAARPATRVGHTRGPGRRAGLCHFTLAWKRDTVLSRADGRSPRSAEDPEGGGPCDRDHDA